MNASHDSAAGEAGSQPAMSTGQRAQVARKRAGLSQSELARFSGVSRRTILNLESGRNIPQLVTLRMIARALGLDERDTRWLIMGDGVLGASARSNLPGQLLRSPLIGRDAEIEAIAAALGESGLRLLTLTGPGGIGKTRLALEAARRHPGLVDVVLLASVTRADEVLPSIAATLGSPVAGGPLRQSLANVLAGERRLLVLDNFEHLLDAAPDIAWLLREAPDLTVMVTSRETLRIPGERVMVVQPLATEGPAAPAMELFTRLAGERGCAIGEDESSQAVVRDLCQLLGGFPLAIELAAAQTDALWPDMLLSLLREAGLDVLATTFTDGLRRFSSMDDAIAWSVNRLSPDDQRLLRFAAVIPGPISIGMAAAMVAGATPGAHPDPQGVGRGLSRLARMHLLQGRSGEPEGFIMLEPIRLFALDRLRKNGEEDLARRAHAEYTAERFGALDADVRLNQFADMDQFAVEYPNGRAALDWAIDAGDADIASRLVCGLKYAHMFRYRAAGITSQLDRLVPASAALTPEARLWVHHQRAELASRDDSLDRLRSVLRVAIDDARATGDPLIEAMALLYWSCDLDEDPEAALATIERARSLLDGGLDTADPPFLQTWSLTRRGVELHRLGMLEAARAVIEESIGRKRREGNAVGIGPLLAHLGRLQQDLGLPRQAARSLLASLSLAADLDDDWLSHHAARWLADLARTGSADAQAIGAAIEAALVSEQPGSVGSPDSEDASPAAVSAAPLGEAIAQAAALIDLLPEHAPQIEGARLTGPRLE